MSNFKQGDPGFESLIRKLEKMPGMQRLKDLARKTLTGQDKIEEGRDEARVHRMENRGYASKFRIPDSLKWKCPEYNVAQFVLRKPVINRTVPLFSALTAIGGLGFTAYLANKHYKATKSERDLRFMSMADIQSIDKWHHIGHNEEEQLFLAAREGAVVIHDRQSGKYVLLETKRKTTDKRNLLINHDRPWKLKITNNHRESVHFVDQIDLEVALYALKRSRFEYNGKVIKIRDEQDVLHAIPLRQEKNWDKIYWAPNSFAQYLVQSPTFLIGALLFGAAAHATTNLFYVPRIYSLLINPSQSTLRYSQNWHLKSILLFDHVPGKMWSNLVKGLLIGPMLVPVAFLWLYVSNDQRVFRYQLRKWKNTFILGDLSESKREFIYRFFYPLYIMMASILYWTVMTNVIGFGLGTILHRPVKGAMKTPALPKAGLFEKARNWGSKEFRTKYLLEKNLAVRQHMALYRQMDYESHMIAKNMQREQDMASPELMSQRVDEMTKNIKSIQKAQEEQLKQQQEVDRL